MHEKASHRKSKGYGFDSRLRLRNIFLSLRLSLNSTKQFTIDVDVSKSLLTLPLFTWIIPSSTLSFFPLIFILLTCISFKCLCR